MTERRETWNGSWCPQCGPDVRIDEDGCCVMCGADATGNGAELALRFRRGATRMRYLYRAARADLARVTRDRDEAERIAVEMWDAYRADCDGQGPDLDDADQPCAEDCDCLDDCKLVAVMRSRQGEQTT